MATTVDTLITEYKLKSDNYEAGTDRVTRATSAFGTAFSGVLGLLTKGIAIYSASAVALVGLGSIAMREAAKFDAMSKALESVSGNAEDARRAMEKLRDIAEMPGLGLQEAMRGYTALRRAGLTDEMAMRTISSSGNANAAASGGRAELERILRAIAQIAMKPNLSGEELMQLNEAGIPASKIIGEKFGTFDGGELQKLGVTSAMALEALVQALEKMPKVAGGAMNSLENAQMSLEQSIVDIGTGLNQSLMPFFDRLSAFFSEASKSGVFKLFGDTIGQLIKQTLPESKGQFDGMKEALKNAAVMGLRYGLIMVEVTKRMFEIANFFFRLIDDEPDNLWGDKAKDGPIFKGIDAIVSEFEKKLDVALAGVKQTPAKRINPKAPGYPGDDFGNPAVPSLAPLEVGGKTLERIAKAVETLASSTIGGTTYGEGALAPVNFSGGAVRQMVQNEVVSFIGGIAARTYTNLNSRRG